MDERLIGLVLYPRFTALDIVGPYEVLSSLGTMRLGFRTIWVAESLEPVRADRGVTIVPEATFDTVPTLDIVVVPGGPGQIDQMGNEAMISFLRTAGAGASIVSSVCTGSLLLAQAGFLDGRRATTHWLAREALGALGAIPVADRVVRDGNVLTGAGVSAGIDFALTLVSELCGPEVAQSIQLAIEYDPQPPFDAGAPEKAPPAIMQLLRDNARVFFA